MEPLVSVLVTTWEQERYVGDALASILAQRTTIPFEVVVGVDASTDATAQVVGRFARESGGRVKVLAHSRRMGLMANFASVYEAAAGPYRALLEGDDYWTSPNKIQLQVEALARHPAAHLCGHLVEQVGVDGVPRLPIPQYPCEELTSGSRFVERLCDFHTSSLVFRDPFAGRLPPQVTDERAKVWDLPLKLCLASRGPVVYLPGAMSVFRRVPGSVSWRIDGEAPIWRRAVLFSLRSALVDSRRGIRRALKRQIASQALELAREVKGGGWERIGLLALALGSDPTLACTCLRRRVVGRVRVVLRRGDRREVAAMAGIAAVQGSKTKTDFGGRR